MAFGEIFLAGYKGEVPSGQESSILPDQVANHSHIIIQVFTVRMSPNPSLLATKLFWKSNYYFLRKVLFLCIISKQ